MLNRSLLTLNNWQPSEKDLVRFFKKVKFQESGCWEWQGSTQPTGYGQININKTPITSHRVSFRLFKGQLPEGQFVCHTCDNRLCVRPEHLFLGTLKENMQDCKDKARFKHGNIHYMSKLTDSAVREIRASNRPDTELAKMYGVSPATVSDAKAFRTWKHVYAN